MATRFELALWGEREGHLRACAEEALREIDLVERQLSMYRSDSDVRELNANAAAGPVRTDARVFRLLERARELSLATDGAFDPTVGPLMQAWGFVGGDGAEPDADAIRAALDLVGMHHLHLDTERFEVRFDRPGVCIDPGAIGKGYAIDCAVESLRENGIAGALIHGGTSTIYAIGAPPGEEAWSIAVPNLGGSGDDAPLALVRLRDCSLSVSAPHGKFFESGGRRFGHVIDPRTGRPTHGALLAAVAGPSATETDALSTALLTLGAGGVERMTAAGLRVLLAFEESPGDVRVISTFEE
jgi:thiamine biosynthesis lipoprotein